MEYEIRRETNELVFKGTPQEVAQIRAIMENHSDLDEPVKEKFKWVFDLKEERRGH